MITQLSKPRLIKKLGLALAFGIASSFSASASAATYSVTNDFSIASNPNGVWSYGWLDNLNGVFHSYSGISNSILVGNNQSWYDPTIGSIPLVWNNATTLTYTNGAGVTPAGWSAFHPGVANQLSDFRFTAPTAGNYSLAFDFQGADATGTTSDVHIHTAGADLFSALINGFGTPSLQSYSGAVFLNAGQTLDIAVGFGANNNNAFDSTAMRGTINSAPVPLPAGFGLFISGLGLLGLIKRRRV